MNAIDLHMLRNAYNKPGLDSFDLISGLTRAAIEHANFDKLVSSGHLKTVHPGGIKGMKYYITSKGKNVLGL